MLQFVFHRGHAASFQRAEVAFTAVALKVVFCRREATTKSRLSATNMFGSGSNLEGETTWSVYPNELSQGFQSDPV